MGVHVAIQCLFPIAPYLFGICGMSVCFSAVLLGVCLASSDWWTRSIIGGALSRVLYEVRLVHTLAGGKRRRVGELASDGSRYGVIEVE